MSIYLTSQKIIKDWTDYNGHMNVAYYVLIFDVYKGENIPNGKKSIAIKIIIQPNLETLTDDDLEKISSDLINVIDTKLSGSLRSQ